jgi:hypothetical protein
MEKTGTDHLQSIDKKALVVLDVNRIVDDSQAAYSISRPYQSIPAAASLRRF